MSSILWVVFKKVVRFCESLKNSILWIMLKKKVNSLSHTPKRGRFDSFESCSKKIQFFESYSKNVHFFESISKEKFNSLSHTGKQDRFNSLSHIGKQEKFNSSRHIEKKDFNSLSQIEKRFIEAQFYESFTKSSILWVFFFKKKEDFDFLSRFFWHKVQFFESYSWKKKRLNSLSRIKIVQFYEYYLEKMAQFFESKFIKKKTQFFESNFENHKFQVSASGTILWVIWKINSLRIFSKKKINSLNHMKTWVTCKKGVRFVESYWKKRRFDSLTLSRKYLTKIQFFESYSKRGSILWVTSFERRFNSLSHFEKRFNSLNHI